MSKISKVLQQNEFKRIDSARANARERFRHFADDNVDASNDSDPGNPAMTDGELARLRPAHEIHPELVALSLRRKVGRPQSAAPKGAVSFRLDPDVIDALRASGEGWQTLTNHILRKALGLVEPAAANPSREVEDIAFLENMRDVVRRIFSEEPVAPADIKALAGAALRHIEGMQPPEEHV